MIFDNKSLRLVIPSHQRPFLYITKIVFTSQENLNWVSRLLNSYLTIKFACIDKNKRERKSTVDQLGIGALITPYHRNPVIDVNRIFSYSDSIGLTNDNECEKWETTIELRNLLLGENETLQVFVSDNKKFNVIDEVVGEIERLKGKLSVLSTSTHEILKIVPFFRLDWAFDHNEFSDEFNIGASKPILLSGLVNSDHKIKSNSLLFKNSRIAQILDEAFLVNKKISTDLLQDLHSLIIKGGGKFRDGEVIVTDRNHPVNTPFSPAAEVQHDLQELVIWYNSEIRQNELHPVIISSIFHHILLKIHPFFDGNGRLARVLSSLILLSYHIPPPVFEDIDRADYLSALRNADRGDVKPLIILISSKIIKAMNYALMIKHSSNG